MKIIIIASLTTKNSESVVRVMSGASGMFYRYFLSTISAWIQPFSDNGARQWLFMIAGRGWSLSLFSTPQSQPILSSVVGMLADGVRGEWAGLKDS